MFMTEYLNGGRDKIYKKDNCVHRPSDRWTQHIHPFLKYMHEMGFDKIPYPYEINDSGIEKLSFVEGNVHNGILPEEVKTDEALISVAELLRKYHDLASGYIKTLTGNEEWMLPKLEPIETMCHGDFAPYNMVMDGGIAIGIIDFDTLHPGPRLWDVAYALYRWIPLMSPDNPENFGDEDDKKRRLEIFRDTYGLNETSNAIIIDWVIRRLEYLVDFMRSEAKRSNETFQRNIDAGHLNSYLNDLAYIEKLKVEL